ncbi:acyl carrier protein [Catenulispora sp. MAP12-49]|uniref:acyl carrier protein n=1 Tax=unclassified Catenulispora TaxID=414885 RepID=UPI0035129D54
MTDLENRLATVLVDRFGLLSEDLDPDATFGDLEIDSICLVELAVISEDEFGVPIGDDDFTAQHTLRTAASLLASKGARV